MRMTTPVRVGVVDLEVSKWVSGEDSHEEYQPVWQPKGVRLDNDGCYRFWVELSVVYQLTFDGTGWRCEPAGGWSNGHVKRLADDSLPKDSFVRWLPVGGSRMELDPAKVYQLHFTMNDELTGSACYLSIVD